MSNDFANWLSDLGTTENVEVEDTSAKKHKGPDLFREILPALDRKDKSYYGKLSQEDKDSMSPWMLMRWMTSADYDKEQPFLLLMVNDIVNNNFSNFTPNKRQNKIGHTELQWMLMTLCSTGKTVKRRFIKPPKGIVKNKLEEEIMKFYPLVNSDELELIMKINTKEDLIEFFKDNAYDDKTITELLKNYDQSS